MSNRLDDARKTLDAVGQSHVLRFFDQLDPPQRDGLLAQIEQVDWKQVGRLVESHVRARPIWAMPDNVAPAPWYPNAPTKKLADKYRRARKAGLKLLASGKVAAFTVAGGQGTRLNWPGPKGTYPATAVRRTPLFCCMAEYLRKAAHKYGPSIPWYVMTSPQNHEQTCAFFEEHGYFGLEPGDVMIFPQAMMPAMDMKTANVLLDAPDSIALAPDGHGGSLRALHVSGAIGDMKARGVTQISYTQVDNPIVKVVDPLFLGLHAVDDCQMSSKMLPKAYPKEKLGNFCLVDGRVTVVEYSNLPDEYAHQRDDAGQLRFKAGSIAIHAIRVDFVESLNEGGFALPFNRAEKCVAHIDLETGVRVEPRRPNAVKLETFVFDALPMCERSIVYETDRVEEFAPIKNADDPDPAMCVDSPSTSIRGQTERAARWLEANGVVMPRDEAGAVDAVVDMSHLTAVEADDLRDVDLPESVERGSELVL